MCPLQKLLPSFRVTHISDPPYVHISFRNRLHPIRQPHIDSNCIACLQRTSMCIYRILDKRTRPTCIFGYFGHNTFLTLEECGAELMMTPDRNLTRKCERRIRSIECGRPHELWLLQLTGKLIGWKIVKCIKIIDVEMAAHDARGSHVVLVVADRSKHIPDATTSIVSLVFRILSRWL